MKKSLTRIAAPWRVFAAAAAPCLLLAPPAWAQARAHRLVLQVEMSRQGELQSGAERGRQRLLQSWNVSAVLEGDGAPMAVNPLDPADAARQAAHQNAQENGHPAERTPRRAVAARSAEAAPPDAAQWQAMQGQAHALMARCGQDRDCLMREARAMSAAQVARGDAALQARLLAARPEDAGEDGAPEPYRFFRGRDRCQLDVGVRVEGRTEGSFDDVQGAVPYTVAVDAAQRHVGDAVCPTLQAVLDVRTGRVCVNASMLPQQALGTTTREERGRRPQRHEGPVALRWMEAQAALQQRLAQLDLRGGHDVQRIAVPGGQIELRVRWSFQPI